MFSPSSTHCMLHTQQYHDSKEIDPLTIEDNHVLIDSGRLDGQRLELLNGSLIRTDPLYPEHFATVTCLDRIFFKSLGNENRAVLRQATPITFFKTESESGPDLVTASGAPIDYKHRLPMADDILLVVEVYSATLRKNSCEKLELYASENIHKYWIVDITRHSVRVLRNAQGKYYLNNETFCAGGHSSCYFSGCLCMRSKLVLILNQFECPHLARLHDVSEDLQSELLRCLLSGQHGLLKIV